MKLKFNIAGLFKTRHERERERIEKLREEMFRSSTPSEVVDRNVIDMLTKFRNSYWFCTHCGVYSTNKTTCSNCGGPIQ